MFTDIEMAPPDPILGLSAAFKKDSKPGKINLGVGVYKDVQGNTPVMDCVKAAERVLLDEEKTKGYLPIEGATEYGESVQHLLFGADHAIVKTGRAATLHTPGGTGALRLAGDFLKKNFPKTRIWMSDPTWANHAKIFGAAGVETTTYPYYKAENKSLDFDAMVAALREVPEGDVVLLHGCCHNPTGQDPTPEQWTQIANVLAERGAVPLLDFAYQGLAAGLEEDAAGLRALCESCTEILIASSFSKNFGLYNERTGALTAVGESADAAQRALSNLQICARTNYSNPPAHGGKIVARVLGDADLKKQWESEVAAIRERINEMRELFVTTLKAKGVDRDFGFITKQNGMFSFSGLTRQQVDALRDKYSIYIVGSGRINVAGMTPSNMDALCDAIADVLKD